jgi:hypothetical protein
VTGADASTSHDAPAPLTPADHDVFELYALSKTLDLPADATRAQLRGAMRDAIVGKAALRWPIRN